MTGWELPFISPDGSNKADWQPEETDITAESSNILNNHGRRANIIGCRSRTGQCVQMTISCISNILRTSNILDDILPRANRSRQIIRAELINKDRPLPLVCWD